MELAWQLLSGRGVSTEKPLELQSKVLRAIQEQEFERLGGGRPIRTDILFIAASNRNLKSMVDGGSFRSDLYHRLHVFPIHVPPLRERREDIPLLTRFFTEKYAQRTGRRIDSISSAAIDALARCDWPGNIRELQNVIEQSVILSRGHVLELDIHELSAGAAVARTRSGGSAAVERERILQALRESRGVVSGPGGAAARLGLRRTTLQARMRKLGIGREYR